MTTDEIRENFLIELLFTPNKIDLVYSAVDRTIISSAIPMVKPLELSAADALRARYFTQRREHGILNIGGVGKVTVDGERLP